MQSRTEVKACNREELDGKTDQIGKWGCCLIKGGGTD